MNKPKVKVYPTHGCGFIEFYDVAEMDAYLKELEARVAIFDAQEVELPEKESPTEEDGAKIRQWTDRYPHESSGFWAAQLVLLCRERQLLDALRAVQAWQAVAASYRKQHTVWESDPDTLPCGACKSYDALAGEGGE